LLAVVQPQVRRHTRGRRGHRRVHSALERQIRLR
jgi:hypothetical protein